MPDIDLIARLQNSVHVLRCQEQDEFADDVLALIERVRRAETALEDAAVTMESASAFKTMRQHAREQLTAGADRARAALEQSS